MTLSNGVSSPVFTARQQDDSNFKTVNITNSAQIRRISARRSNVGRITFMDAKGQELYKLQTDDAGERFPDEVLNEGEEIIGIYGAYTTYQFMNYLGIIVWKPPRQS